MTKKNPYLWPSKSTLVIRDRYGEVFRSSNQRFDLADAIMLSVKTAQRTVTLSFILDDPPGEDIGPTLEKLIRYDIEFDGYSVRLDQQEPHDWMVSYEWRLRIRPR